MEGSANSRSIAHRTFDYAQGRRPPHRDRRHTVTEKSHDPPLQSLKSFLEAALLGPVALGDRIGEGER